MNLQELRDVQDAERSTDSLQELPDDFYEEVSAYIKELKAERAAAAEGHDDPFDAPEVSRLSDEIRTAEQVAAAIYERRMGKLLTQASLAAADMGHGVEGLTTEERELYEDLVERIGANKRRVLDVLEGTSVDPSVSAATTDDGDTTTEDEPDVDAAGMMGEGPSEEPSGEPDDAERITVQVTRDVGEVFGVDEQVYDLAADDVVSLPVENATALIERDAARRLD